jgi:hypothetical protein
VSGFERFEAASAFHTSCCHPVRLSFPDTVPRPTPRRRTNGFLLQRWADTASPALRNCWGRTLVHGLSLGITIRMLRLRNITRHMRHGVTRSVPRQTQIPVRSQVFGYLPFLSMSIQVKGRFAAGCRTARRFDVSDPGIRTQVRNLFLSRCAVMLPSIA